ncbi:MAG: NAD-dependent epimerase/dehydratase family protein, partial [Candidatus Micrarchaeaceae archaeon]
MTGGAGFIGSNMVEALLKLGANVVAYDNLSSGRYEFLKEFEKYKGFKFIEGDLLNLDKLSVSMKRSNADAVVHLAANPDIRLGIKYTNLDLRQGTIATYNVLEAARKSDVRDILFSSSSVVYGRASIKPTPENYGPLLPISLYGAAKLASEGLITSFSNLFGMRYYIYRFANVVGKNGT